MTTEFAHALGLLRGLCAKHVVPAQPSCQELPHRTRGLTASLGRAFRHTLWDVGLRRKVFQKPPPRASRVTGRPEEERNYVEIWSWRKTIRGCGEANPETAGTTERWEQGVRNMADKQNHNERLERLMNQLAEAVLGLSDETILAGTDEGGSDPEQEAERTRLVLRQASKAIDDVNNRLSNLGHAINSYDWRPGQWGYHNNCLNCGLSVSFTTTTGEMRGDAFDGLCPESDQYTVRRREASR
jgi:hypothetical protein